LSSFFRLDCRHRNSDPPAAAITIAAMAISRRLAESVSSSVSASISIGGRAASPVFVKGVLSVAGLRISHQ